MTAPVPNGLAPKAPNPAPWVELQQSLPSRVAMISPFVDQLMEFLKVFIGRFHGAADSVLDIEISLREALANAMIHGNRENPVKKVHIAARCSMNGEVSITVQDEGEGFDDAALPDPQRQLLTHGRELYLMGALMDEVSFEQNGTFVRLKKRLGVGGYS
jgi:serine/threonine-protein kinase RsbW